MSDVNLCILNDNESCLWAVRKLSDEGKAVQNPAAIAVIMDQVIPPNSPQISMLQKELMDWADRNGVTVSYGESMTYQWVERWLDMYRREHPGLCPVVAGTCRELALLNQLGCKPLLLKKEELLSLLETGRVPEPAMENDLSALCEEMLARTDLQLTNRQTEANRLPVRVVFIGGSLGGRASEIQKAAQMIEAAGGRIAYKVRLLISPASSEDYVAAADAGWLKTIAAAGGMILNQCASPAIQGRFAANEVMVTNDIHDEDGFAGPAGAKVYKLTTEQAMEYAIWDGPSAVKATSAAMETSGAAVTSDPAEPSAALETDSKNQEETGSLESGKQGTAAFEGRVIRLGNDIDTDIIIPTQYLNLATLKEMQQHCFEPLRPELAAKFETGDIIVAGSNFGCGSSREQAAEVIVASGVKCVIARSFARIFFRNAINNGLLLIEQPDLVDAVEEGDRIFVTLNEGIQHQEVTYPIGKIEGNLYHLIMAGGLVKSVQRENGISEDK